MGLAILLLGLAIFVGAHSFVSLRGEREKLIKRIGEGPYKGLFSLVSIIGVLLIIYGFALYRFSGPIPIWYPPDLLRHVNEALMWPSFVFVAAAYIPGYIKQMLKHPMLAGVKLWAFAHLLSNGDLGGIVLFGSILTWAVYDRISLKHRDDGAALLGTEADVSGGRIPDWRNDATAIFVGTVVYLAVGFVLHPLAGVPVFGLPGPPWALS
jgi:uncharacterized membrane protein